MICHLYANCFSNLINEYKFFNISSKNKLTCYNKVFFIKKVSMGDYLYPLCFLLFQNCLKLLNTFSVICNESLVLCFKYFGKLFC